MNVFVKGIYKGTVEKDRGRWVWWSPTRGTDIFPKLEDRESVKRFIARVCLATPADVEFSRRAVK